MRPPDDEDRPVPTADLDALRLAHSQDQQVWDALDELEHLRAFAADVAAGWEQMKRPAHRDSAEPYLALDRRITAEAARTRPR